jgi:hypothetical protein
MLRERATGLKDDSCRKNKETRRSGRNTYFDFFIEMLYSKSQEKPTQLRQRASIKDNDRSLYREIGAGLPPLRSRRQPTQAVSSTGLAVPVGP